MIYAELAEKLIAAKSEKKRLALFAAFRENADEKLAETLKNICYESWTNTPPRVRKAARILTLLTEFNDKKEIEAFAFWGLGIADLTNGKTVSAIANLDHSAAIFRLLKREYEAAQTQVAKLYALALLGRYEEAVECGENALAVFEKNRDELAAGKIEKNLGNIVSRQERHKEAERYYRAARRRFLKIRDSHELTMCENGLAMTYAALNDFRRAERFYASALKRAQKAGTTLTVAEVEASMGNLALFRGRYDEALRFLESSRQRYETLLMPHQTAIAELEIADVYLELNLNREAAAIYERVAGKLRKLKMQGEEARARGNFGRAAAVLNAPRRAGNQLRQAAKLYESEKNKTGAAAIKILEANLELNLKNYENALRLAREAAAVLRNFADRRFLIARFLEAEAWRNLGETETARKIFASFFDEAIKQEQPSAAQSAQIALGEIEAARQNYSQAEKHFKEAIRLIETTRAPLAAEEFRMAFLADKLKPFENLAKIHLQQNDFEAAFLIVEKSRARSLFESLEESFGAATDEKETDAQAKLRRRLKALREELNWFYSRLNRAAETEIENLQIETGKREKQIADLTRRFAAAKNSSFGKQKVFDLARLRAQLGEEKALVEFVNFDGNLSAFVVSDQTISFVKNLGEENDVFALLEDLRFQFGSLRYGADSLESFLPELKKRADFYLKKLHEKLLAPLEDFIGKRDLIIVPVGALHYVPFHALFDSAKYEIERREIVYAPSASVWQFLAAKPPKELKNALLVGFADERVPLVTREIESLSKVFPAAKSLTSEQATFAAYAENAADFDALHLACHGQFRPENPMLSSLHLADGWITAQDVCAQRLRAEIVTLSACETGLHKIFAGEEILGLARGFLTAGAQSLVLSLWTVNDAATAELMTEFYKNLQRGKTAAASLRAAQIKFIKRAAHPYFWSPFALIGK